MTCRAFTILVAGGLAAGGILAAATPAYAETVSAGQIVAASAFVPVAAKAGCSGDLDSSPNSVAVNCMSGKGTQYNVATSCRSARNPEGYKGLGPWTPYGAPGISRFTCKAGYHTVGFGVGHRNGGWSR